MQVRFWGTRGSIPTPGPDTVRYGGNTSCVEVATPAGTLIVLDAGTGLRALGDALLRDGNRARRGHLFIGHTHWDHIQGFPFFAPLFTEGCDWDVYAPRGFDVSLRETLAGQMQYRYFPVTLDRLSARLRFHDLVEGSFTIGDTRVTTRYLNHPALTLGYRLEADGAVVVYSSDHECHAREAAMPGAWSKDATRKLIAPEQRHLEFLGGADVLIHDAQYTAAEYPDKIGWGHSTVEYVVDMAIAAGVRKLVLYHHDPARSDAEVDQLVDLARRRAKGAGAALEILGAAEGATVKAEPRRGRAAPAAEGDARTKVDTASVHGQIVVAVCNDLPFAKRLLSIARSEHLDLRLCDDANEMAVAARGAKFAAAVVETEVANAVAAAATVRAKAGDPDLPILLVTPRYERDPPESLATQVADAGMSDEYVRTRLRSLLMRTRARWEPAPLPADEPERLKALQGLRLLDTPAEERFDRITRLAARILSVPIALITLVDSNRQWFKSRVGEIGPETPREQAFCAHAILDEKGLLVPDALADARFADNPLVLGAPHVRFYAGSPIHAPDGHAVGTLCIIDHRPRELSAEDVQAMRDLAGLVEAELARPAP